MLRRIPLFEAMIIAISCSAPVFAAPATAPLPEPVVAAPRTVSNLTPTSDAIDPWTACKVSELAGTVRAVRCAGVDVRFMRAAAMGGERGVAFVMAGAKKDPVPPLQWLEVDDRRVAFALSDDGVEVLYVAAPLIDTLVHCVASGTDRRNQCERRVRWVAKHGLPQGVSFPPANLTFMGALLTVPAGCKLSGPERIACGKVSLDWRAGLVPMSNRWETVEALYRAAGLTITKSEPRGCALGGVEGEGRDFLLVDRHGKKTPVLACYAGTGATGGAASCIGASPVVGAKYPVPCDQIFGKVAH